ncbi:polyamine transporter 4 [Verticillium dahliae VdLs.17]|uniref:Polyamine transporter 4 n=1 Tax=Verticillium dahliae (strain VdLs.17 / ATCC MYA-4575 / FGSC 10137) TaxID=498257 RepID=G2WXS2_VERDV|nr:polyamine transporter 4 [Verticillium dahliae VdLs.17]EGY20880.1 polyamine transporter 4 [Verticillium dahliae VdLs.17]
MTASIPLCEDGGASTRDELELRLNHHGHSLEEEIRLEILDFESPDDPDHPHNWALLDRVWATFLLAAFNLVVTIGSSIFGSAQDAVAREFGVSEEVTILGTSLYLVGYIFGPLLFGPLSEKFGRKYPLIGGVALSSLFGLMPALGHSLATIFIGRFLSGFFGVAPIAVLGGIITDCWNPASRSVAMAFCIFLVFSGPTFGPIIGGFIVSSSLSWRWTMWVVVITGLGTTVVGLVAFTETYPPKILQKKAKRLRQATGNSRIRCALDEENVSIAYVAQVYLIRPWRLFFTEVILVLLTLYQSFIYGVMYLFYQSYPIAFGDERGWDAALSSLALLGIILGVTLGTLIVVVYNERHFKQTYKRNGGTFEPEVRLPLMIFGGCLVPAGMFWYAWTSSPEVPWPSQVCASILIGCGMYTIFIQCFTYIVDCYTDMANSAMAANGAVRSIFGAAFPLFARYMYRNLGVAWATSLLGFLSVIMVPVPVLFWYYGARVRAWSTAKAKA